MSDEMNKPKLCPFCGKKPKWSKMSGYYCGCDVRFLVDWNTRPIEDKLLAQLAERDALIERLVEAGCGYPGERWYSICREWQAMKGGEG